MWRSSTPARAKSTLQSCGLYHCSVQEARCLRSEPRHHHCRHQVRVWPGRPGQYRAGRRDADPGFLPLWPLEGYEPGHGQPSFDKQFVRDWLKANPDSNYDLPQEVIDKTIAKYEEAYELLTARPCKSTTKRLPVSGQPFLFFGLFQMICWAYLSSSSRSRKGVLTPIRCRSDGLCR